MYGVLMNWKGYGKKGSWLNADTLPALVWKTEENHENPLSG
jgi:hypothetical protein